MKHLALILITLSLAACKPQRLITEVPVRSATEITARPVNVSIPQDHASLGALFTCDSNNRVIMNDYRELYSEYMNLQTRFTSTPDGGMSVEVSARTMRPDTVIIVNDTTVFTEVPVITPVEVPVKLPFTRLEKALFGSGVILWLLSLYKIFTFFKFKNPFSK
jgi:hypothetical protein